MWLRHRIVHRGGWRARLVADVASSTCKFKPIKWEVQDDSTVSTYPKPHRFPPPPDRPDRRAEHVQSGRPQHQRGIGAAEAEAVVEHRLHLALLRRMRDEIDPRATLARMIEVERGRHDLITHREDAEDRFDRACTAEQVLDRRFGRTHRQIPDRIADRKSTRLNSST